MQKTQNFCADSVRTVRAERAKSAEKSEPEKYILLSEDRLTKKRSFRGCSPLPALQESLSAPSCLCL